MKLTSTDSINDKLIKNLLNEENDFINIMLTQISIPSIKLDPDSTDGIYCAAEEVIQNHVEKKMRANNYQELYEKWNQLRGVKKLTYNDKLIKKSLKSRLKKKDQNKVKKQQKKENIMKSEKNIKNHYENELKGNNKAVELTKGSIKNKPIFNSEGHIVFSKFDFSEVGTKKKPPKLNKNKKNLLEEIKNNTKIVTKLKKMGDIEKAKNIVDKYQWNNAILKASGKKVKDDAELLKKSMKREEIKKKKSGQKWESRHKTVENDKKMRQSKRKENILNKIKDKKLKIVKKAVKKGRIIPGF